MKRMHLALLVSIVLALVVITVTYQPAAAASCKSAPNTANCDGKDPIAEGCGQTSTIKTIWSNELKIELRYSADCKSAWTRLTGPTGGGTIQGCVYRQEYPRSYCYSTSGNNLYTDMVYIGQWYHAKACGQAISYAPWKCTAWFTKP